jgi:hypothetical protein
MFCCTRKILATFGFFGQCGFAEFFLPHNYIFNT